MKEEDPTDSEINEDLVGTLSRTSAAVSSGTSANIDTLNQPKTVDRSEEIFQLSRNATTYEVNVESEITLEDYKDVTSAADWKLLQKWAEPMKEQTVVFINPTMQGGGVAMLRPPLVHLLHLLGVDAHWYVMEGQGSLESNPFIVTKKMHNIIQRRTAPDDRITSDEKAVHKLWNAANAKVLTQQDPILSADIIVIDDPQPAPLKRHIERVNPSAKWVWRNHVDNSGDLMNDPETPQGEVWQYLRDDCKIGSCNAFVYHPVQSFVPPGIDAKTFFAPATVEPFDDLNRDLTNQEITEGIDFINSEITIRNLELESEGREVDVQQKINPERKRLVLIARFDESKGMDIAMELGVRVREKMRDYGASEDELPQVVLIGNGSVDDPSGIPMYEKMLKIRRTYDEKDRNDIIVMRLRHNYQAMNAVMYPTDNSSTTDNAQIIGLQTSQAEGCETRITDWIRHGVPVVVSSRGGMSLQVKEDRSGIVLDYDKNDYDIERGVNFVTELMTDTKKYAAMRESTEQTAEEFNNREFVTTANVARWLRVFTYVLKDKKPDKKWKMADLVD